MRLWEVSTGRPLATLQVHIGGVWGVALSADGHLLVPGGADGLVRLWEAASDTCLHALRVARRYNGVDITGLTGVTEAHHAALLALGDVEPTATLPGVARPADDVCARL